MQRTCLAMVQTAPRKLEARSVPIPKIDDDTALLRIETCGICGSDYEQFEGLLRAPIPAIPGHEPLGIIEAIGDRAAKRWGVEVGDRVAVETMLSCRFCAPCLGGKYHLCDMRRIYSYIPFGEGPGLWGAYAEYMFLDTNTIVHKMDPDIPAEIAVMFNPLGAGFRWAVEVPNTKPGDSVMILGPGQRGLASVLAAKNAGASTVIVTGLEADARKLKIAQTFGADYTIDVENENVRHRVKEITNGRGVDIVVDVTPYATQPVVEAMDYVRMGGTVVLAGAKGGNKVSDLAADKIMFKEITVKGVVGVTWSGYDRAIRFIEEGNAPLEMMHTHDFDLRDAEQAIKTLAREIDGDESIHSCLIPGLS